MGQPTILLIDPEDGSVQSRLANLRLKLAENGIDAENCPSGQYSGLICPEVKHLSLCLLALVLSNCKRLSLYT